MDLERKHPTGAVDLVIRFASSIPDLVLTIARPEATSTLGLKQLIRPHLPEANATNRLRLIAAGKVLPDAKAVSESLSIPPRPPPDPSGKGKAPLRPSNPRVYVHCSIGDALSAAELAAEAHEAAAASAALATPAPSSSRDAQPARSTAAPPAAPRGFDRLLDAGYNADEVAALRTQFLAMQAHTHTPDEMPTGDALRALEDRWLDDDVGGRAGATGGGDVPEGPGEDAGLEDMLWGNVVGFFWPVAAVCWLMREEGVWSRRRQVAVLSGILVNLTFGFLRLTN